MNTSSTTIGRLTSMSDPRAGELSSLRRGRANQLIPRTSVSEQVNVMMVSGHTVTCPYSDSGDEDSTIPLVVGRTEGVRAMVR